MRCFLIYHAREIWGEDATMFSKGEYEKIKAYEDNLYTLYKDAPEFNAVSNGGQFWFLMQAIDDKDGTIELLLRKKFLSAILFQNAYLHLTELQ
jgi:hypothetical protein